MFSFPKTAALLFFLLCLSIFFNIPILRPVLGFLWLSLIPGYALLRILKLDEWSLLDIVVFSAGLGLAIVMLLGLILNSVYLAINSINQSISIKPFLAIPFAAALGSITLVLLLLGWSQRKKLGRSFPKMGIKTADIPQILALAAVLVLGITGALYHNISFLLAMIIGVSLLIAISILSERWVPSRLFPLVIASCSVALLFHTALISQHLMGVDIFLEFYVFSQTAAKGVWIAPGSLLQYSLIDDLNSILSITILPTAGTAVLGIEGEVFFKVFYPIVFSIVPLALYKMYRQQVDTKIAFLSTMLYISLPTVFYGIEPLALCRQTMGQLFLVLTLTLIIEKKLASWKKNTLLILLVSALITTHYSLAYIFLFFAVIFYVAPRVFFFRERLNRQTLSLAMILLILVMTFSWYTYVSSSPLNHVLSSINKIASAFGRDFSSTGARGFGGALSSLSPLESTSAVGWTHKILIYLQFLFIGIGVVVATIKPKTSGVSSKYWLLGSASATLLALCVGVPNLATTLNATRFYAVLLMFLAPFFVSGGVFLVSEILRFVSKVLPNFKRISVGKLGVYVVTSVLIATFLFQVGFVNHITNDYPYSYSLDLDRKETSNSLSIKLITHSLYFLDQEVCSAEWLATTAGADFKVYADSSSQSSILKGYATLPDDRMIQITNNTRPESQTYIYLKYITTQLGLVTLANGQYLNSSEALSDITTFDRVYSNGISDIYFVP